MADEPGPATRRRQLGRQLRDLRLAAGYKTMEAAASRTGLSRATISRIESAKQTILPRTVRLLCQAYGIGAPLIDHLVGLAEVSDDRGWLVAYSDTMPDWFERYADEEAEAQAMWMYQVEYVPGLFQTVHYCEAVSRASSPDITDEGVRRHVAVRFARQSMFYRDNPPTLHAVLNEAVIRRQVGGAAVMREQLEHLVSVSERQNITIQILPYTAGAHPAMTGAFTMLHFPSGDPTIFVEVDSGALYPDRPLDVERYTWMFRQLCDLALSPSDTATFISTVAGKL